MPRVRKPDEKHALAYPREYALAKQAQTPEALAELAEKYGAQLPPSAALVPEEGEPRSAHAVHCIRLLLATARACVGGLGVDRVVLKVWEGLGGDIQTCGHT